MSKRLKRVYSSNDQVIHLWANQSQSDARSGSVFFEGSKLYSYGYHYLLGQLHTVKGTEIAVINSTRYSNTTAKHQSKANQSVYHKLSFNGSDPSDLNKTLLETQDNLMSRIFNIFTQRNHYTASWHDHGSTAKDIADFNTLCDLLKQPKMKIEVPQDLKDLLTAHIQACSQKETEKRRVKQESLKLQASVDLEAWKLGGPLTNALRSLRPQLIRINQDMVETTQGAQVPLKDAIVLLKDLISGHAEGLILSQTKIGGFQLTEFDGKTVTIGCHQIDLTSASEVLGCAS